MKRRAQWCELAGRGAICDGKGLESPTMYFHLRRERPPRRDEAASSASARMSIVATATARARLLAGRAGVSIELVLTAGGAAIGSGRVRTAATVSDASEQMHHTCVSSDKLESWRQLELCHSTLSKSSAMHASRSPSLAGSTLGS